MAEPADEGGASPSEQKGGSEDREGYAGLAAEIADPQLRSRVGFGAFHHFDEVFRETIRLVLESATFMPPTDSAATPWMFAPWMDDPEFWHLFGRRFHWRPQRSLIRRLLYQPRNYDPAALWALFWALAKAEYQFLVRYLPFWSHEERLTGHLVAETITRIEDFATHWNVLSPGSELGIWYADTAAHRQESETGADLGLIIHGRFAGSEEFFKVARFQAKKAGTTGIARIDFHQAKALLRRRNLGYYLFYHAEESEGWHLCPTVVPAGYFEANPEGSDQRDLRVRDTGYDFATFITFALADQVSSHGVLAQNQTEAVRILMAAQGNLPSPSRVLTITLGTRPGTPPVDWTSAFSEYVTHQSE